MTNTFESNHIGKKVRFTNPDGIQVTGLVHDQQPSGVSTDQVWLILENGTKMDYSVHRTTPVEVIS